MIYDYPTAFTSWGAEEREAIQRVIASDRFTMGAEVEAFEAEFAEYHGMKHCVMVNSGSSANLVAIAALFHLENNPLKRGDKVAVPALAWATTYAPLIQHGLRLELIDCGSDWNADSGQRISSDVRVIMAASILGHAGDMYRWQNIANARNAYLIEDNCESVGASCWRGAKCGSFGFMSTASFYYSHQLSAIEGGAILTNSRECYDLCRMLRNHGWSRGVVKDPSFAQEYDFRLAGYNVRPIEMHAAIAREQLKRLDSMRDWRRINAAQWNMYTNHGYINVPLGSNPFCIKMMLPSKAKRDTLAKTFRANGIDCRPAVGGSFTKHPYGAAWRDQSTPCADHVYDCGLMIGNAPFDISEKIERAAKLYLEAI